MGAAVGTAHVKFGRFAYYVVTSTVAMRTAAKIIGVHGVALPTVWPPINTRKTATAVVLRVSCQLHPEFRRDIVDGFRLLPVPLNSIQAAMVTKQM